MKIIGLTGGIGSGKSTVCKVFNLLGIPVYNSDIEAKILMNTDVDIVKKLKQKFGNDLYYNDKLDRKKLADSIFNDKDNINYVNKIVHPVVKKHFNNWTKTKQSEYAIKEAAILFESGVYKDVDYIITVTAPKQLRIKRIIERDHLSEEDIRVRISNQISDNEKIKLSDFTINNNNEHLVLPQILKIHNELIKRIK